MSYCTGNVMYAVGPELRPLKPMGAVKVVLVSGGHNMSSLYVTYVVYTIAILESWKFKYSPTCLGSTLNGMSNLYFLSEALAIITG